MTLSFVQESVAIFAVCDEDSMVNSSGDDGRYSLTDCGHCNEDFPNVSYVPGHCYCNLLETCNKTAGVCIEVMNETGSTQRICSGDCFVERNRRLLTLSDLLQNPPSQ